MKNRILAFLGLALFLAIAIPLRAQTGCDDSPEDPTIALALVGSTGILFANLWRMRRRKK